MPEVNTYYKLGEKSEQGRGREGVGVGWAALLRHCRRIKGTEAGGTNVSVFVYSPAAETHH